MVDENHAEVAATAAVQAVTDNASRLGLTWDLRPAAVSQIDSITGITVTVDGDETPITATSMIGGVFQGQRVYVLLVPPGGVFIVGNTFGTRVGTLLRRATNLSVTSGVATTITWDTIVSTSGGKFISVPGTTVAVPVPGVYGVSYAALMSSGGGTRNFCTINFGAALFGIPFRAFYGPTEAFVSANAIVPLSAGATFTCDVFQNSGGTQNMLGLLAVTLLTA